MSIGHLPQLRLEIQAAAAATSLHNDVLPCEVQQQRTILTMLTDNGTEFCSTPKHPYDDYLPHLQVAQSSTPFCCWDQFLDDLPLAIG